MINVVEGEFNNLMQKADSVYASSGISFDFFSALGFEMAHLSSHISAGPLLKNKRYTLVTFRISAFYLLPPSFRLTDV